MALFFLFLTFALNFTIILSLIKPSLMLRLNPICTRGSACKTSYIIPAYIKAESWINYQR
jgi:hypothetical protein